MIFWEIRKSINVITVLIAVFLCGVWFFVCRIFFVGDYEDINGEIYRDYINDLSRLTYEEQREYVEIERAEINYTVSSQNEMREKYLRGEISDEEYLNFNELYENCAAKSVTFSVIDRKFDRITANPRLQFTYDLELEGHLTTMTADFPLLIMLSVVGCGVFISEIPINPFIKACKNGRRKVFIAKLSAYLIICVIMISAFNIAELAALFSKSLGDLSAPAASMEKFDALDINITCLSLIAKTFLFRIFGEIAVCMMFFALSSRCKNHIAFFCSAAALLIIPAFFINIIPNAFKGFVVYYMLMGSSVLAEKTEYSVLLGSVFWIVGSWIAVKKPKDKSRLLT